jgi:phosphohistidine phosphatase
MKTLLVMRHAKSDWESGASSDFDRPLNSRGKNDAPEQGKEIKKRKLIPELIISSPANRALTTAKLASKEFDYNDEILLDEDFYFGNITDIVEKIKLTSNKINRIMIVGHNPTWSSIVELLSGKYVEMKTASVAVINFETSKWSEIEKKFGNLETYF